MVARRETLLPVSWRGEFPSISRVEVWNGVENRAWGVSRLYQNKQANENEELGLGCRKEILTRQRTVSMYSALV